MNDFLNRYWPMVITATVLLLILVMVTWIPNVNLPGKGLLFKIMSTVPIQSSPDLPNPRLGLDADDVPVSKPFVTTLVISNTGNIPIKREDYETPLQITLMNEAEIVQLRYILNPPEINTKVTFDTKKAQIAPALLNPDDSLIVQIFTKGGKPEFSVGARILGIKHVIAKERVAGAWGEIGWLHYLAFFLSIFPLFLLTLMTKADSDSRYVFVPKKVAVVLFLTMAGVPLFMFFSLMADHAQTIFASRVLLLACTVLTLVAAWLVVKHSEDKAAG